MIRGGVDMYSCYKQNKPPKVQVKSPPTANTYRIYSSSCVLCFEKISFGYAVVLSPYPLPPNAEMKTILQSTND